MSRNIARLAVTGALVAGAIGAVAAPALAATPWSLHGYYASFTDCSRDGAAAVRGPWNEYSCNIWMPDGGYQLWLR
jgi:hypothetical protein